MLRTSRRLMDRASQLWWPGSVKALRGLDWGRRGSGMTELLWWNSLSWWLSLGLFLDDCFCIFGNLSDRTDDGTSPCCECQEDMKWIYVGVAACSGVVSWVSAKSVVTTPRVWESSWCSGLQCEGSRVHSAVTMAQSHHPQLVYHGRGFLDISGTPFLMWVPFWVGNIYLAQISSVLLPIVPCQNSKWSYLVAVVAAAW